MFAHLVYLQVKDIVDFKFVPWGNGKILNNQQVSQVVKKGGTDNKAGSQHNSAALEHSESSGARSAIAELNCGFTGPRLQQHVEIFELRDYSLKAKSYLY